MATTKLSSAISEIRYYTNYSDPAAPVIMLGAIAEALNDKTLVLAIVGRAALTAAELATVSGHNRAELEDVWGTLTKAFKSAWDQRPRFDDGPVGEAGMMLKYLAEKYSMSLHFETPQPLSIPRRVAEKVQRTPKSLGNAVLSLLEARLAPPKTAPRPTARRTPRLQRPVVRTRARPSFREAASSEAVAVL